MSTVAVQPDASAVTDRVRSPGQPCLLPLNAPLRPRARVVVFPWAGAGVRPCRRIFASMRSDVECLGVRLPGREDVARDAPLVCPAEAVGFVMDELKGYLELPLVLVGHSMGAALAYAVADQLERVRRSPARLLVVSGAGAPGSTDRPPHLRCGADATDEELVEDILSIGGTSSALLDDPVVRRSILGPLRADYALLDALTAVTPSTIRCPIDAFGAHGDTTISARSLDDWSMRTSGAFAVRWFEGDHFYLGDEPQVFLSHLVHTMYVHGALS